MITEALETEFYGRCEYEACWVCDSGDLSYFVCLWSTLTANQAIGTGYVVGKGTGMGRHWNWYLGNHRSNEEWYSEQGCSARWEARRSARIFFGAR
jgi:hypothetical protein